MSTEIDASDRATSLVCSRCHLPLESYGRLKSSQHNTDTQRDDCTKSANYWFNSLASAVVRRLEHIVNDSIIEHLTNNKMFLPKQHGFPSGKSIKTNLLELYKVTTNLMDQGNPVNLLLLYFATAFNIMRHSWLHSKLPAAVTNSAMIERLKNSSSTARRKSIHSRWVSSQYTLMRS